VQQQVNGDAARACSCWVNVLVLVLLSALLALERTMVIFSADVVRI
jgi:hypothetical protein